MISIKPYEKPRILTTVLWKFVRVCVCVCARVRTCVKYSGVLISWSQDENFCAAHFTKPNRLSIITWGCGFVDPAPFPNVRNLKIRCCTRGDPHFSRSSTEIRLLWISAQTARSSFLPFWITTSIGISVGYPLQELQRKRRPSAGLVSFIFKSIFPWHLVAVVIIMIM